MKKKLLAVILVLSAVLACAFGLSACYKTTTKDGLIIESVYLNNACWVVGIENKDVTEVVIPSKFRNKTVVGISKAAFYECKAMTSITIPDSVTSIGKSAFKGCESLTSITIPDSVISIGTDAFLECDGIIQTEDGVHYVDNWVVGYDKETLANEVTLRNGTRGIADRTFRGCEELTSIIMPDSVTIVGVGIFYNCSNLSTVKLSGQITSLPCYVYAEIMMATIYEGFFENCKSLTDITIPDGVTTVDDYTFYNCSSLKSLTLGSGVTSFGKGAFFNCWNSIENITVNGNNAKYHSSDNCLIDTEDRTLVWGCKNSVIPNDGSVTKIGGSAFVNCSEMTDITIPDGITYIGSYAFKGCYGLTEIKIPESVKSIGEGAFYGCSNIIQEKDGVEYVDNWAVDYINSDAITSLNLSDDTRGIAASAFENFRNLSAVTIPYGIKRISSCAFFGCIELTSVSIPESVEYIGDSAFEGCRRLTEITIPKSVTAIAISAFKGCSDLTNVILHDKVTAIGSSAFEDCVSLASITIPQSVASIGYNAFRGCNELTSVIFEDTAGWQRGFSSKTQNLKPADLANAAKAAKLLKEVSKDLSGSPTYPYKWTKTTN